MVRGVFVLGRLCRDLGVTPTTPIHRLTGAAQQYRACAGRDGQAMNQTNREGSKGLSTDHTLSELGMWWQSVDIQCLPPKKSFMVVNAHGTLSVQRVTCISARGRIVQSLMRLLIVSRILVLIRRQRECPSWVMFS
jgi:hypothetical protein